MAAEALSVLTTFAVPIGTVVAAGLTGVFAWLVAKLKGRADLVAVAQNAAREVIGSLQDEVGRLGTEVGKLRGEVKELRDERHRLGNQLMRERRRADVAEAAVRQLRQAVDSLQRRLAAAGLPVDLPGGYRDPGPVLFDGEPPPAPPEA